MSDAAAARAPHGAARWVLLEEAAIRYACTGDSGRPLLLLHEMGGSMESWEPVLQHLPAGQRIIRCDVRGSGGSEKIRAVITPARLADDVAELLDHLGLVEAIDVAGVSMGGCLGLILATRHPERVSRLASVNPPVQATGAVGDALHARAEIADRLGMRGITDAALERSYPHVLRDDRPTFDAYRARFFSNDPTSYAHIVRALAGIDLTDKLGGLRCETLFMGGRHDLVRPPAQTEAFSRNVPGAGFREIEGGHIPSVQAPASIAAALGAFLGWTR